MAVTYKKLWHILIDRNMKKKDLESFTNSFVLISLSIVSSLR